MSLSPRGNAWTYQVVYSYDFDGSVMSNPRAIRALQVNPTGHTGGGMAVLDSGSILLAFGDNGDAFEDGRSFAQDDVSHLSKIVELDPVTGSAVILGKGVRNVQRIDVALHEGQEFLDFVDIGGNIAEELNRVWLSDLMDPSSIENFGWGRSSLDNLAREGTFYVDSSGNAVGDAPLGEAGFMQPFAEWGREGLSSFAGSGPISCSSSLTNIGTMFGDLPNGFVYGVKEGSAALADVFRINLFDALFEPTTLAALSGGRPDPRFVCVGDDSAGVLLERIGDFYRIDEFSSVPEPSSVLLLSLPLVVLFRRRGRQSETRTH